MPPQKDVDALGHGQGAREAPRELGLVPAPELKPAVALARLEDHRDAAGRHSFLHMVKRMLTTHAQLFAQLAHAEAAAGARQSGNESILKVLGSRSRA